MELDEDLKAFLVESNENLSQIEGDLVALEQAPDDAELMNRIYRALHTLKGNCGFLGFETLQAVAHAGESLLSRLRDRTLVLTAEITTALLDVVDAIQQILTALNATGEEGDARYEALVAQLERLQTGSIGPVESIAEPAAETVVEVASEVLEIGGGGADAASVAGDVAPPATKAPPATEEVPVVEEAPVAAVDAVDVTTVPIHEADVAPLASHGASVSDRAIRVDVALLDKLMNLVGELVLCRNQILEHANNQAEKALIDTSQRLNIVTTELQEGVMQTRMQPIRNIWSKFPRVVRDISLSVGKQVQLEMEGEDTELDKTLIEAIADPLTHLVRNCVDHGIEAPADRIAAGKPESGQLFLRAFHESGYVNIEISDDGKGIDSGQIKLKAVQRGLISPEQAARLSEQEALNLVFLPGLSTATRVTNLSGRGVGMDVVQTNIDKIGGSIDVASQQGRGTSFKLKIPLTLAIIPTLIVASGGERYAIPQVSLIELVRLEGAQAHRGIEMVHGAPVYRLRGKLLPLVYLNRELQLESRPSERLASPDSASPDSAEADMDVLNILVLQATDKPFGLLVDSINDTQEIVVKPLGKQLKGLSCFAGATIMGDGQVALILDVQGLAQRAHVISEAQETALMADSAAQASEAIDRKILLLFEGPNGRQMALPLDRVTRLEKIQKSAVEGTERQHVIQYRDQILPLIYLSSVLAREGDVPVVGGDTDTGDADTIEMVVVSVDEGHNVGLVVENILDIVEERILITGTSTQPEIDSSVVIQDRITELIDVDAIIRAQTPTLLYAGATR